MDLGTFLDQFVEGYLLADLESMRRAEPRADGNGACVYPMVMTTCAGIELLGRLSTDGNDAQCFRHYWSTHLYKYSSEHEGRLIYEAVRHGLAHLFVTKGDVLIRRNDGQHLALNEDGRLCLDATRLATDFASSYRNAARAELIGPGANAAQRRLTGMLLKVGRPSSLLSGIRYPHLETPPLASGPSGMAPPRGPIRDLVLTQNDDDDDD